MTPGDVTSGDVTSGDVTSGEGPSDYWGPVPVFVACHGADTAAVDLGHGSMRCLGCSWRFDAADTDPGPDGRRFPPAHQRQVPAAEHQPQWDALVWAATGGTETELKKATREQAVVFQRMCHDVDEGLAVLVETSEPQFLGWKLLVGREEA